MSHYGTTDIILADLHDDEPARRAYEAAARISLKLKALSEGHAPLSEPTVDWHEITQAEVDREAAALLPYDLSPAIRAGDWRVRIAVEVA